MQTILLTLCSAGIISVLCDVLISGGSVKKYARLAIGISVSTILVMPIVDFLSEGFGDFNVEETISYGFIDIVDSQYITILNQTAETALLERGITAEVFCEIENAEIVEVIAVCEYSLTKETAEEVGFALCEILSVPLSKVKVRAG